MQAASVKPWCDAVRSALMQINRARVFRRDAACGDEGPSFSVRAISNKPARPRAGRDQVGTAAWLDGGR